MQRNQATEMVNTELALREQKLQEGIDKIDESADRQLGSKLSRMIESKSKSKDAIIIAKETITSLTKAKLEQLLKKQFYELSK